MLFTIENNGPEILATNYWQSEHAARGYLYLSINAGAFRLLVPPAQEVTISEMLTGREAIISRGPWADQGGREALEILFEDLTDAPYSVCILAEQCDRLPADSDRNRTDLLLSIWTTAGKAGEMPARYRKVKRVPWLKPWRTSH